MPLFNSVIPASVTRMSANRNITLTSSGLQMALTASESDYNLAATGVNELDNLTRWARADLLAQRADRSEEWGDVFAWAMERFNFKTQQQISNEISLARAWPLNRRQDRIMTIRDHAHIRFTKALKKANRSASSDVVNVWNITLQDEVIRWVKQNIELDTWLSSENGFALRRYNAIVAYCRDIKLLISQGVHPADIIRFLRDPSLVPAEGDTGTDALDENDLPEEDVVMSEEQIKTCDVNTLNFENALRRYLAQNPNVTEVCAVWRFVPIVREYQPSNDQTNNNY